jgi:peptidoglycan/xylan/chitin deacetylase (PgdA/CDA1 family)
MPHGGADNTQKILNVLADYGVKATFFVVGN